MDEEQFNKLMAVNRETQDMQAKQGETLHGFGKQLGSLSEEAGKQSETLNGMKIDMAKLEQAQEHIKERAAEDRTTDKATRTELEGKVREVHVRVNDVPALRGEFENHIADEHATLSATTEAKVKTHIADNNRHGGEAPGGGAVKTGATVAGGVTVGGGIIWGIVEVVKLFSGA